MLEELQNRLKDCEDILFVESELSGKPVTIIYMDAIISNVFELAMDRRKRVDNLEQGIQSLLSGNVLMYDKLMQRLYSIEDRGFPGLGVVKTTEEKVLRGSEEGLSDSIKTNTALLRKHIRTTELKLHTMTVGERTATEVAILHMDGIARGELVSQVTERLGSYAIDGVLDSGVMEQLTKRRITSPFPEVATTRRPDRAAQSLLEGKIVLLFDHSPVALILPCNMAFLLKTADDYYNSFWMASLGRLIRYAAVILSFLLPGLYLVATNYHTQVLPTPLILALQEARQGVPFTAAVEILLMELSFELLREAGVRLPGVMGNTIGIVGGLIIGQAAVEAGVVSPIVVILVALTALCSFAIPDEDLAFSFRLMKFVVLFGAAGFGLFGFLGALLCILIHLSKLESYGVPYLMPFVASEYARGENWKDAFLRAPLRLLKKRPVGAVHNITRVRKE